MDRSQNRHWAKLRRKKIDFSQRRGAIATDAALLNPFYPINHVAANLTLNAPWSCSTRCAAFRNIQSSDAPIYEITISFAVLHHLPTQTPHERVIASWVNVARANSSIVAKRAPGKVPHHDVCRLKRVQPVASMLDIHRKNFRCIFASEVNPSDTSTCDTDSVNRNVMHGGTLYVPMIFYRN
ncbi:hypothetical protein [Paraburkholderia rhizosphaerae]|nr:hypothetical protein [Paraburkholderia rhizosphaerae]